MAQLPIQLVVLLCTAIRSSAITAVCINSRSRGVEGLEDDLDELLPVALRVERSLGVEMRGLVGGDSQLVVEGVVPDLLHVVPVGDDTVLDGVFEAEDPPLALGFVSDVAVFGAHTSHDDLWSKN